MLKSNFHVETTRKLEIGIERFKDLGSGLFGNDEFCQSLAEDVDIAHRGGQVIQGLWVAKDQLCFLEELHDISEKPV